MKAKSLAKYLFTLAAVAFVFAANMASAFYLPEEGRWLPRDPIGENGGLNLYDYVNNNPINVADPLGLDPYSDLFGAIADGNAAQIQLVLDTYADAGLTEEQAALGRTALQHLERKAAEETARVAAKQLEGRCINNVGKLANKFNKTPGEIKDALHKAKNNALQRFKGKGMKANVNVTVDPDTGEIYPQIPGGGLGDSVGNILN
jgi:uncharacterized protein RhaS with RHS repeats